MPSVYPRFIAGVDPGLSTGLFVVRVDPETRRVAPAHRFQGHAAEALGTLRRFAEAAHLLEESLVIVGERFTVTDRTGKRTSQPLPLKILGAVEAIADQSDNVTFSLQTPADAKKLAPNDVLRNVGFYTRPVDVSCPDANDVNDAARHVLLALATRYASVFDQLLREADLRATESQR